MLDLVAKGLTNDAIARRLYLSDKTVRNYVSTLFTKLGVSDRAAAVAKGSRRRPRRQLTVPRLWRVATLLGAETPQSPATAASAPPQA